ncbi:protein HEATR9 [Alligator sinensis]|uniref:Protein HEATR9 n=1 Tax=Alligator sinensis TaxID=38654 RepID=A0A3Q0G5J7_ALLSI|nr:protein HEATR9 [Alligator sinensis]
MKAQRHSGTSPRSCPQGQDQNPDIFPLSPSTWRKTPFRQDPSQLSIVEKQGLVIPKQHSSYLIKADQMKLMMQSKKASSRMLISNFLKASHCLYPPKIKYVDNDPEINMWKRKRMQDLIGSLASSVEQEQVYTAQALGCLGETNELVLSALQNALQVCRSLPVRYEVTRSLVLLGCLEAAVVRELIGQLKRGSPMQRTDMLAALRVALHTWAAAPEFQRMLVAARSRLIQILEQLASSQGPTDDSSFSAAACLAYLDSSNPTARETLQRCLVLADRKMKMQALILLVRYMKIASATIIQALLDQLCHSPVYKYRADSASLLSCIGLWRIQQEDLEDEVFMVLLEKLHCEPFLVVRQMVAMTVEVLHMKEQVWDIVENQLKEKCKMIRRQAVASLGALGLPNKQVFFTLLEMLETDSSEAVRIQVIKTFSILGMNKRHVLKSLLMKVDPKGPLGRECVKALRGLQKSPSTQRDPTLRDYEISQEVVTGVSPLASCALRAGR